MNARAHIRSFLALTALGIAALAVACGGDQPREGAPARATATNPVDPATAARLQGTITLKGTPPPPQIISRRTDLYCDRLGQATTQTFVVSNAGLENVFVYVKDGLGDRTFPVPATPVVLDQQGCTYVPRVFGIQAGQPLEIRNSDDTLHNIHALPANNREFNRGQGLKGIRNTHVFTTKEVMVPFNCDVHKWMNAWVGVLDHPFYAVSGRGGAFEIGGLPPGTYTIEAWHEALGTRTQRVTLAANESGTLEFVFEVK